MPITQDVRHIVARRANYRCEYCLIHEDHAAKQHEVDRILSRKHGGSDEDTNLAWSCFICNRCKGSDVGAYDLQTGQLVPFFNPRTQNWNEHFCLEDDGEISGLTDIGRATLRLFQFNSSDRVEMRRILMQADLYIDA